MLNIVPTFFLFLKHYNNSTTSQTKTPPSSHQILPAHPICKKSHDPRKTDQSHSLPPSLPSQGETGNLASSPPHTRGHITPRDKRPLRIYTRGAESARNDTFMAALSQAHMHATFYTRSRIFHSLAGDISLVTAAPPERYTKVHKTNDTLRGRGRAYATSIASDRACAIRLDVLTYVCVENCGEWGAVRLARESEVEKHGLSRGMCD